MGVPVQTVSGRGGQGAGQGQGRLWGPSDKLGGPEEDDHVVEEGPAEGVAIAKSSASVGMTPSAHRVGRELLLLLLSLLMMMMMMMMMTMMMMAFS